MLSGGCQASCSANGGTLSCNGNFVQVNSSEVQKCLSELEAICPVMGSFEASGSCENDNGTEECMAQAKGSISCAVAQTGWAPMGAPLAGVGFGLALLAVARRRRREDRAE